MNGPSSMKPLSFSDPQSSLWASQLEASLSIMCLNHPETIPSPQSLVPKSWGPLLWATWPKMPVWETGLTDLSVPCRSSCSLFI